MFITIGGDENTLATSLNTIKFKDREEGIKLDHLYHQYIRSNFITRAQNCTTVTDNDNVLPVQQVELIKQLIVSEFHNVEDKINKLSTQFQSVDPYFKKLATSNNAVHKLLQKVVDNMTLQNVTNTKS